MSIIVSSPTLHTMMLHRMDDAAIAKMLGCELVKSDNGPAASIPDGWYEITSNLSTFSQVEDRPIKVAENAKELSDEQVNILYYPDAKKAFAERAARDTRTITISKKTESDLVILLNCELRRENVSLQYAESLNSVFRQLFGDGVLCGDHERIKTLRKLKPSYKKLHGIK